MASLMGPLLTDFEVIKNLTSLLEKDKSVATLSQNTIQLLFEVNNSLGLNYFSENEKEIKDIFVCTKTVSKVQPTKEIISIEENFQIFMIVISRRLELNAVIRSQSSPNKITQESLTGFRKATVTEDIRNAFKKTPDPSKLPLFCAINPIFPSDDKIDLSQLSVPYFGPYYIAKGAHLNIQRDITVVTQGIRKDDEVYAVFGSKVMHGSGTKICVSNYLPLFDTEFIDKNKPMLIYLIHMFSYLARDDTAFDKIQTALTSSIFFEDQIQFPTGSPIGKSITDDPTKMDKVLTLHKKTFQSRENLFNHNSMYNKVASNASGSGGSSAPTTSVTTPTPPITTPPIIAPNPTPSVPAPATVTAASPGTVSGISSKIDYDSLKTLYEESQAKLADATTKLNAAKDKIDILEKEPGKLDITLRRERDQAVGDLFSLKNKIDDEKQNTLKEKQKHEETIKEKNRIRTERDDFKNKFDYQSIEFKKLKKDFKTVQGERDAAIANLNKANKELEDAKTKYTTTHGTATKMIDDLGVREKNLNKQIDALNAKVADLENRLRDVTGQLAAKEASLTLVSDKLKTYQESKTGPELNSFLLEDMQSGVHVALDLMKTDPENQRLVLANIHKIFRTPGSEHLLQLIRYFGGVMNICQCLWLLYLQATCRLKAINPDMKTSPDAERDPDIMMYFHTYKSVGLLHDELRNLVEEIDIVFGAHFKHDTSLLDIKKIITSERNDETEETFFGKEREKARHHDIERIFNLIHSHKPHKAPSLEPSINPIVVAKTRSHSVEVSHKGTKKVEKVKTAKGTSKGHPTLEINPDELKRQIEEREIYYVPNDVKDLVKRIEDIVPDVFTELKFVVMPKTGNANQIAFKFIAGGENVGSDSQYEFVAACDYGSFVYKSPVPAEYKSTASDSYLRRDEKTPTQLRIDTKGTITVYYSGSRIETEYDASKVMKKTPENVQITAKFPNTSHIVGEEDKNSSLTLFVRSGVQGKYLILKSVTVRVHHDSLVSASV